MTGGIKSYRVCLVKYDVVGIVMDYFRWCRIVVGALAVLYITIISLSLIIELT